MSTSVLTVTAPPWRHTRREYRHAARECSRLLFVGYLPPGTHIEIRCPACGRMHVIQVDAAAPNNDYAIEGDPPDPAIDTEQ